MSSYSLLLLITPYYYYSPLLPFTPYYYYSLLLLIKA